MDNGKFRQVAADFFVAPQLVNDDFAMAARCGIKTIINNRPDGEEFGQLSDVDAKACAKQAGLAYVQVPVISGGIFPDHIAAMRDAILANEGPYLAYCRSGTRSCYLWSFVAAQEMDPDDVVRGAADAGYDIRPMTAMLRDIHANNQG